LFQGDACNVMSDSSQEAGQIAASDSESDGHPADALIVTKAAKRRLELASIADADAPATATDTVTEPKRKKQKRKKSAASASLANATASPAAEASRAPAAPQQQQAALSSGKPRKTGSAALLSPSNAQQLQQRSPAPATPPTAAPPAADAGATLAVRPDPADAAELRTPAPLGVIVVEDDEANAPNSELQRLLRAPRSVQQRSHRLIAVAKLCSVAAGSWQRWRKCSH